MKLSFKNGDGKKTIIADHLKNRSELWKAINDFLSSNGWTGDEYPYRRIVGLTPRNTMIDFGSHTAFLYVNASFKTVSGK